MRERERECVRERGSVCDRESVYLGGGGEPSLIEKTAPVLTKHTKLHCNVEVPFALPFKISH